MRSVATLPNTNKASPNAVNPTPLTAQMSLFLDKWGPDVQYVIGTVQTIMIFFEQYKNLYSSTRFSKCFYVFRVFLYVFYVIRVINVNNLYDS